MLDINGALKAIGFRDAGTVFAVGVVKTCSSAADLKRRNMHSNCLSASHWQKAAVTYGLDLMLAIFQIIQGMVSTIITRSDCRGTVTLHSPGKSSIRSTKWDFGTVFPYGQSPLLGGLFITVLSFVNLTVYSRMFKLYMYTALAPIPCPALPESLPAI